MLSAVLIVQNEEKKIEKAITSLYFCDEIVVVDDNSKDDTVRKIRKIDPEVKITERDLDSDFATQRNFGLSLAKGDWILFVDADEIVTHELAKEIQSTLRNTQSTKSLNGFYVRRIDYFLGAWLKHGENGNIKLLRLGRKNKGQWEGKVHEIWKIEGETKVLQNVLLHYSHDSINDVTQKMSFYSTIRAQELFSQGVKSSTWQIVLYPLGKFIQNYFLKLGLLDGMPGLIMAVEMAFHSYLVRSKLYLLNRDK